MGKLGQRPGLVAVAAVIAATIVAGAAPALALDLSAEGDARERAAAAPKRTQATPLSKECRAALDGKKVAVVFNEGRNTRQSRYSGSFGLVAGALQKIGLAVYSQEEIDRAIAQAQAEAQARFDAEAATEAARRLAPAYVMRVDIGSRSKKVPNVDVNQVAVDIAFTVTAAGGEFVGSGRASGASYAGADVVPIVRDLIRERIGGVVNQITPKLCAAAK